MKNSEVDAYLREESKHWWFRARRKFVKRAIDNAEIKEPTVSLLDVGCATGFNLNFFFSDAQTKIGVDVDSRFASYANDLYPNFEFFETNIDDYLDSNKIQFSVITMLDLLYHESILRLEDLLRKARANWSDSGYLIIADGVFDILVGANSRNACGTRKFTISGLESQLKKVGFDIVYSQYWGFSLIIPMLIKRRVLDKLSRPESKTEIASTSWLSWFFEISLRLEFLISQFVKMPMGSSLIVISRRI